MAMRDDYAAGVTGRKVNKVVKDLLQLKLDVD